MPRKILIFVLSVISLAWLVTVCVLAKRFNIPSGDGILYSLPLAMARNPFDFGVPFLDNFDGYGSAWGHQWPGAMWLKGLIFAVIPYSRTADVALLSIFQLLAAASASLVVWKATLKWWAAGAALILILSDRLLLLACAGNRFETIAVAVVILLFADAAAFPSPQSAWHRRFSYGLAFICPTLHPYALMMGAIILGYECISAKLFHSPSALKEGLLRVCAYACGCAAMVAWFIAQPEALHQFKTNLSLQASFYQSWNAVLGGLSNYRIHGGTVLWGAGLLVAGLSLTGKAGVKNRQMVTSSPAWRFLAPALFLSVIVIHTVTRCENFTYLAFGSPFAVMMICVTAARMNESTGSFIRWIPITTLCAITALHGLMIPYRLLQFKKAGMPDIHAELAKILKEIPPDKTIYIPYLFWSTAIHDKNHRIRWSTFPIASPRITRERYEEAAYASAKQGDLLIIDRGSAGQPDRFGVHPTFNQLLPDPATWEWVEDKKKLFSGSIPWGIDLSIYRAR